MAYFQIMFGIHVTLAHVNGTFASTKSLAATIYPKTDSGASALLAMRVALRVQMHILDVLGMFARVPLRNARLALLMITSFVLSTIIG